MHLFKSSLLISVVLMCVHVIFVLISVYFHVGRKCSQGCEADCNTISTPEGRFTISLVSDEETTICWQRYEEAGNNILPEIPDRYIALELSLYICIYYIECSSANLVPILPQKNPQ